MPLRIEVITSSSDVNNGQNYKTSFEYCLMTNAMKAMTNVVDIIF